MIKQMENLGYHGPFRDPSVLRMFDARVAVMRLLSEQIYQLDIPGNVAELGVFRGEFSSLISAAFPDRKIHLFDTFEGFSEKDITIEASGNLSRAKTGDFFFY
ncbi:TylF/MycF family methyltransferase [Blautia wexlerae]|nr:TylF/MycF family methyltransferase [Blautia wexlerae]